MIRSIKNTVKALVSTFLTLGVFLFTWLPHCRLQVSLLFMVQYNPVEVVNNVHWYMAIDQYMYDLLMVGTIVDSIIYTLRIPEVKDGILQICLCRKKKTTQHSVTRFSMRSNMTQSTRC